MEQSRYAHISRSLHFHIKFADNVCIYWKYLYFNMNFAVMIKKIKFKESFKINVAYR